MKKLLMAMLLIPIFAHAAELTCGAFDDRSLCRRVLAAGEKDLVGVTAEQAFKKYAANEVAADNEFKSKYVIITGKVLEISKDWQNSVVLTLRAGPGLMDRVQLRLFERQISMVSATGTGTSITSKKVDDVADKIKVGQQIEAECKGSGMVLKTPIFRECLL